MKRFILLILLSAFALTTNAQFITWPNLANFRTYNVTNITSKTGPGSITPVNVGGNIDSDASYIQYLYDTLQGVRDSLNSNLRPTLNQVVLNGDTSYNGIVLASPFSTPYPNYCILNGAAITGMANGSDGYQLAIIPATGGHYQGRLYLASSTDITGAGNILLPNPALSVTATNYLPYISDTLTGQKQVLLINGNTPISQLLWGTTNADPVVQWLGTKKTDSSAQTGDYRYANVSGSYSVAIFCQHNNDTANLSGTAVLEANKTLLTDLGSNTGGSYIQVWKERNHNDSVSIDESGDIHSHSETTGTVSATTYIGLPAFGSVTSVTATGVPGFSLTVTNGGTTPVLTPSFTVTGIVKGNGSGGIAQAVSGTDYLPITGGTSVTTLGTITTGIWNGFDITPQYGGTGVSNGSNNSITFTGNYSLGLTLNGNTSINLPSTGTVVATSQVSGAISMSPTGVVTISTVNPTTGSIGSASTTVTVNSIASGQIVSVTATPIAIQANQINNIPNTLWAIGGNSVSATSTLGTIDSFSLIIKTKGVTRDSISPIGTMYLFGDSCVAAANKGETVLDISNSTDVGGVITPQTNHVYLGVGKGAADLTNTPYLTFGASAATGVGFNLSGLKNYSTFNISKGTTTPTVIEGCSFPTTNVSLPISNGYYGGGGQLVYTTSTTYRVLGVGVVNGGNGQWAPLSGNAQYYIFSDEASYTPSITATGRQASFTNAFAVISGTDSNYYGMYLANTVGHGLYVAGNVSSYFGGSVAYAAPTTTKQTDSALVIEGGVIKAALITGTSNYIHAIFTPTTAATITLNDNQYNIINPAGSLAALTITLPSSPLNNDVVLIKYTQAITAVTYTGGTVVDGITAPTAGGLVTLVYDSSTSSWY